MANASNVKKGESKGSGIFAVVAIIACLVLGIAVWHFIMGNGSNFQGGVNTGDPLPGNYLAMVYKGGKIVPVLMGLFLMVVVFSIERFFVITKAAGKNNLDAFVSKVQRDIANGNIDEAMADCDKQKGSVANVIKAALIKYNEVKREGLDSEKATETIQKEIEEATSLEMPMLEKNLTIISTLVSIGTLAGLLGTVMGMITAFGALATSGTPDQAQLANGISEALINTATGISTSTLAIIAYNYFTSKIDTLTYSIDEAGFSIAQTYRRFRGNLNSK
jgi:biopolymer transport protein ExbB